MRPHKEIVELGQRISEKVDKMSAKQMADAWNKSHPLGDKNPMKWTAKEVESNIPYHSMYLKGSLLEDELTEDEHSKYFAEGGETEFGVGGFILGLGAGVLGTKYLDMYGHGGGIPQGYHRMPDGTIMADSEHYARGGEIGKYPFYTLLEGFGIDMAFNSEKDAKAYIKHEAELVYEGMPNEQKKERAEFRKQYRILTREEAKNFNGYVVPNIDEEVGSSYKDYAKGGEVDIHKYVWKVKLKSGETITKDEFIENYDGNFKYVQNIILNNKKPVSVEWYLDNYKEGDLYGNPTYAKGGMVKKSDFTMLGAGLLIGGLFAFLRK